MGDDAPRYTIDECGDEEEQHRRPKSKIDPMVRIVMNPDIMKIAAVLVAKLEHVKYEETRRGVFRTTWARDLFNTCVRRLSPPKTDSFGVNEWYAEVSSGLRKTGTKYEINPQLYVQCIDNNWLMPLFEMEIAAPGFMVLLHNTLEMEDSAHSQLAKRAKDEVDYDFLALGVRNSAAMRPAIEGGRGEQKKGAGATFLIQSNQK